ncbi:MAG: DUF2513 domain-containing protein [Acidobacteria bacterium]|nr:DUF2513 domain-containing protein [Acidobacteriota bacterium]
MHRYMQLIRAILEYCTEQDEPTIQTADVVQAIAKRGTHDEKVVLYHVDLCIEAGYLALARPRSRRCIRVTWQGHEQLTEAADE